MEGEIETEKDREEREWRKKGEMRERTEKERGT